MRILVINALFPPDRTGSSIFSMQLADEFASQGHEVRVITASSDPGNEFDANHYQIDRVPHRKVSVGRLAWNYSIPLTFGVRTYRILRKVFTEFEPDIVLSHGQIFDLTWMASIVARISRVPHFVVVHTAIWHEERKRRAVLRILERLVISPVIRLSNPTIIAVDKWTHNDAKRRIARDRAVHVIPVSVDASHVLNGDARLARDVYELGDGPLLLSLGHVVALRNRMALIEALPNVLKANPALKVVVVGDVRETHFLERAKQLDVIESVVCLGSVPHSSIRHLLAAASVESHDLQGLGLGITSVESMIAGVPIVAVVSDDNYPGFSLKSTPGIQFLDSSDTTTLASALNLVIHDDDTRQKAIVGQHQLALELFNPERNAKRYLDVFKGSLRT